MMFQHWKSTALTSSLIFFTFAAATVLSPSTAAQQQPSLQSQRGRKATTLNRAFEQAAREFDVPSDLLRAIAFSETRFDNHSGKPSLANGFGLMHLIDNPRVQTLPLAAKLLGVSEDVLKTSAPENIRGAAAILRLYADEHGLDAAARADLSAWYEMVARYSHAEDAVVARLYAEDVFKLLSRGFSGTTLKGETITVAAQAIEFRRGKYEAALPERAPDYQPQPSQNLLEKDLGLNGGVTTQSVDYPSALWVPARFDHFQVANRPSSHAITHVIIHTVQGSYASAISWFRDPSNPFKTSSHYVIRSSDGEITQMVREKDIAHHIGGWNSFSLGIEHEGWVDQPAWYTDVMYRRSAELTRHFCLRYNIPMTRDRIRGHSEVPGATHTDPGPHWNWTRYMQLVTEGENPPWSYLVGNTTAGRFTASGNWGTSSYNAQRYGSDYRYVEPAPVSDAAWYKFPIPETANYEVLVWYPASSGYNSSTPIAIQTTGGVQFVRVNQQINGGQWVSLGVHQLASGDYNVVGVSRWTSTPGYVIADAVQLIRR